MVFEGKDLSLQRQKRRHEKAEYGLHACVRDQRDSSNEEIEFLREYWSPVSKLSYPAVMRELFGCMTLHVRDANKPRYGLYSVFPSAALYIWYQNPCNFLVPILLC